MDSPVSATATTSANPTAASPADNFKRKRSPSISGPAPKTVKTSHQLSINYLARQSPEDLPLINKEDSLPNLIHLLAAYHNILDRHESLASNLGARPLGPNLIKRFERCFEAPPKVVASHHKGAAVDPGDTTPAITWLEVIEFARSHPSQFTLSTFSEGRRVCQFYYPQKQLRVQVSEEDFIFINSGRCQELIPPLPIWEDEEKEVGTVDVLEVRLKELTNVADTVAARTRQLSHRLKTRRAAILERRAEGGSGTPAKAGTIQTTTAPPSSLTAGSSTGFNAVNSTNGRSGGDHADSGFASSAAVRNDLLRIFEGLPQNRGHAGGSSRNTSIANGAEQSTHASRPHITTANSHHDAAGSAASSLSPVPNSMLANDGNYGTPEHTSSRSYLAGASGGHRTQSGAASAAASYTPGHAPIKHNFSRPLAPDLESTQPFRPLCQSHMDSLARGARVVPPCDRCRRLRMDCVKNLTSCAGCTKKHARCHWRDVSRDELSDLDQLMEAGHGANDGHGASPTSGAAGSVNGYTNGHAGQHDESEEEEDDDSNPLEDLEALEEKEEEESRMREDDTIASETLAPDQTLAAGIRAAAGAATATDGTSSAPNASQGDASTNDVHPSHANASAVTSVESTRAAKAEPLADRTESARALNNANFTTNGDGDGDVVMDEIVVSHPSQKLASTSEHDSAKHMVTPVQALSQAPSEQPVQSSFTPVMGGFRAVNE